MSSDTADPDVSSWTEQPDKSRDYVYFIRLFYTFKKDASDDIKYGEIGNLSTLSNCTSYLAQYIVQSALRRVVTV